MIDAGDIIGAKGGMKRTEKGELSLVAASVQILTKSLAPLPDKWHGLADIEKRYRQRCSPLICSLTAVTVPLSQQTIHLRPLHELI